MSHLLRISSNISQPGSNTVSMFDINPSNPLDLKMVGKPISSGGELPVSVDMNPKTGDGN
jgi:hypothetical protein